MTGTTYLLYRRTEFWSFHIFQCFILQKGVGDEGTGGAESGEGLLMKIIKETRIFRLQPYRRIKRKEKLCISSYNTGEKGGNEQTI